MMGSDLTTAWAWSDQTNLHLDTSTYHSSEPTENVGRNPILRKTLQGILAVHLKILTTAWDSQISIASSHSEKRKAMINIMVVPWYHGPTRN